MSIETQNNSESDTDVKYRLEINGHVYAATRKHIDASIKVAKDAMKGKKAVVAVEKDNVVMMASQPHETVAQLNKTIVEYVKLGYKVYKA